MQRAHRDILGGPWADAGNLEELAHRRTDIGFGFQIQLVRRNSTRELVDGRRTRVREPDGPNARDSGVSQSIRRDRDMRQRWMIDVGAHAKRGSESRHQGRCTAHAHLLSENCANGELKAVDGAGNAQAATQLTKWREAGRGEMSLDRRRINVEVEQMSHAYGDLRECGHEGRGNVQMNHRSLVLRHRFANVNDADVFADPQRACVYVARYVLDAGCGSSGQESEKRVPRKRRTIGERQCDAVVLLCVDAYFTFARCVQ